MSNKITCNGYLYTDDVDSMDILSGNVFIGNSLAGEELTIDTLDATLNVDDATFTTTDGYSFQTADGNTLMVLNPVSGYKYGDIVTYEHDDALIIKSYLEKQPKRTGLTKYDFSCVSAMGLLDKTDHNGGIYVEKAAGDIIAELMGDIPYTVFTDVSTVPMNGWLPIASCRENLHQVLFAIGAGVFKDANGDILIRYVTNSTPTAIDDDRIYIDGSIDYKTPCTRVDVTEHMWSAYSADEVVTLYDGTDAVTAQRVEFESPCHDLSATGLTIVESGVNYAVVSGTGKLTGKKYTHTTRVVSYSTGITGTENIAKVKDATLVSAFNSYNVALRVGQYYSEVRTVSGGLVVGDERPATQVSFTNPFNEVETGYIKSLDMNISATLKADAIFAIGFLPTGQGNNFNNHILLTGSGTWTVPTGKTWIKAILVNPGQGGQGGQGGDRPPVGSLGAGGTGGAAGQSGKVFEINLNVIPGQNFSYSAPNGTAGTAGSAGVYSGSGSASAATIASIPQATTFGDYSSNSGTLYQNGYSEPKSGLTFAMDALVGVNGGTGSGSDSGNVTFQGQTWTSGSGLGNFYSGGGAAVGSNGGDGSLYGGYNRGGNGANANNGSDATHYGEGGSGGHGGGAGGGVFETSYIDVQGTGGTGGAGGNGGDGCVVIYW